MEEIVPLIEEYAGARSRLSADILTRNRFVHQHDEEYAEIKKNRRAGRPASTREDVLRIKIAKDLKEYENGFCRDPFQTKGRSPRLTAHRYARPHSS